MQVPSARRAGVPFSGKYSSRCHYTPTSLSPVLHAKPLFSSDLWLLTPRSAAKFLTMSQPPTTIDFNVPADGLSLAQLEERLNGLTSPVRGRLDLRSARLPITATPLLVHFLRRELEAIACIGNNSFSAAAFFKELLKTKDMDLFETDRLTLGWTEQETEVTHLAAAYAREDKVQQLADTLQRYTDDMKVQSDQEKLRRAEEHKEHEQLTLETRKLLNSLIVQRKEEHTEFERRMTTAEKTLQTLAGMDPSDMLKQIKAYQDIDGELLERNVNAAVAAALDDGEVIIPFRYGFQGEGGDLDGLVAGSWRGEKVIVFVEAKHNMDSCYRGAKQQLFTALAYWERLVKMQQEGAFEPGSQGERPSEGETADWRALQVSQHCHRSACFAFGACKFSDPVAQKQFAGLRKPWFRVMPDDMKSVFTAEYRAAK